MTPKDIESVVDEIIQRRFKGRMISETLENYNSEFIDRTWVFYAPGTTPKNPSVCHPEGNLGFIFWLRTDALTVEVRHVVFNPWIRWVQDVFKHELAQACGVERFDCGDGMMKTNPGIYKATLREYALSNLSHPLSAADAKFLKRYFMSSVPEGYDEP
jgi:hypothetical protein